MGDTLSTILYGAPGYLGSWSPTDLGSDLKLWLRPEELANPNRLLHTEDPEDAAWTLYSPQTLTGGQTDPDGGSTAWLLANPDANGDQIRQDAQGSQAGADDVLSVWWKRGPGHNGTSEARLQVYDGVDTATYDAVPSATWERVQLTHTLNGSATVSQFRLHPDITTGASDPQSIYFWHPQLESGTSASTYVANGATAGGLVASWADQSGLGNDATQGTQASMPLVQAGVLDGYAGALFDGVDDALTLTSKLTMTGAFEVWCVTVQSGTTDGLQFADGNTDYLVNKGSGAGLAYINPSGAGAVAFSTTGLLVAGNPYLMRSARDGSNNLFYEQNGADKSGGNSQSGTAEATQFGLRGGTYHGGTYLELLAASAALSADDRASMLAYFSGRYPTLAI